jgi:hypothetical protein
VIRFTLPEQIFAGIGSAGRRVNRPFDYIVNNAASGALLVVRSPRQLAVGAEYLQP